MTIAGRCVVFFFLFLITSPAYALAPQSRYQTEQSGDEIKPEKNADPDALLYVFARLERIAGPLRNKRVLDVGADAGSLVRVLREHGIDAEGLELSRSLVEVAHERGIPVMQGNLLHPPSHMLEKPYDVVVSRLFLDGLIADEKSGYFQKVERGLLLQALRQLAALTKPGGINIHEIQDLLPVLSREDFREAGFELLDSGDDKPLIVLRRLPKPNTAIGSITHDEFMRFASNFAEEAKRRMQTARMAFANFPPDAREDMLTRYAEQAMLMDVSAQLFPAFLEGRPLPSWDVFQQLGTWTENELKDTVQHALGKKYYFDALGDLAAILACRILYEHKAEELSRWSLDMQRTAIWILMYNYFHIHIHLTSFEFLSPYPDNEDLELEPRSPKDPFALADGKMTPAAVTWESFHNRPLAERIIKYSLSASAMRKKKDGMFAGDDFPRQLYIDFKGPHAWITSQFNARRRAVEVAPSYPPILQSLSESQDPKTLRDTLLGLFKMSHMPAAQVMQDWERKAQAWQSDAHRPAGAKPVLQWIREFADVFSEPPMTPSVEIRFRDADYKPAQTIDFPRTTALIKRIPMGWQTYLKREQMEKMESLINNALLNIHAGAPSYKRTKPVIWTAKDLSALTILGTTGISGIDNLTLMLVGLFSPLFDIHALIDAAGNVEVKLDPLFTRWQGSTLEKTCHINLQGCQIMQALMENPHIASISRSLELSSEEFISANL